MKQLWYLYITLIGCNLIAAAWRWRFLGPPMKLLFFLLCWGFVIEICRQYTSRATAAVLTHINLTIELLFQFAYYYVLLERKKRSFLYAGITAYVVALFVTWQVSPDFFRERNYLDAVYLGVCMTLWCGLFFYELIQKPLQYSLKSDGNFWANCGNILFYPGTMLLFGLGNYMEHINPELSRSLKSINYTLNLTLYALYLAAFFRDRKQSVPLSPRVFIEAR